VYHGINTILLGDQWWRTNQTNLTTLGQAWHGVSEDLPQNVRHLSSTSDHLASGGSSVRLIVIQKNEKDNNGYHNH